MKYHIHVPVQKGKTDANAGSDDDNDDGVDVQKIVQHCHFKSEFLVYDHDNTFDDQLRLCWRRHSEDCFCLDPIYESK